MSNPGGTVRIVNYTCNANQLECDLLRISKHGYVELEDEQGLLVFTKEMVRDLARDLFAIKPASGNKHRYITNPVFSTPTCIETKFLRWAAHNFAKRNFSYSHQYVLALNDQNQNPKVYLTILNFGFDGRCLQLKQAIIQQLRESFKAEIGRIVL